MTSFVVGNPDLELPVWAEWPSTKRFGRLSGAQLAGLVLAEARRLLHDAVAFFYGNPPPWCPSGYVGCVVGYDLSWHRDAEGRRPSGVAPFRVDLGPPATSWDRRACFIDSDAAYLDESGRWVENAGTPQGLAQLIAHEIGHLVGVGHEHGEPWTRPDIVKPNAHRARDYCVRGRAGV